LLIKLRFNYSFHFIDTAQGVPIRRNQVRPLAIKCLWRFTSEGYLFGSCYFRRIAKLFLEKFRNLVKVGIIFINKEFSIGIKYVRRDE
jgi:hypothetical protein